MRVLIIKRLGLMVVMLIGLAIITFTIANIAPGDPARLAAGPDASAEMVEQIRISRGFDKPIPVRFFIYMGQLARGDLGTSVYTGRPVVKDIAQFLPATFELVFFFHNNCNPFRGPSRSTGSRLAKTVFEITVSVCWRFPAQLCQCFGSVLCCNGI